MKGNKFNNILRSFAEYNFEGLKSFSEPTMEHFSENSLEAGAEFLQESTNFCDGISKSASSFLPSKEKLAKRQIRELVGKTVEDIPVVIGTHPDFKELEAGGTENHYIVSVFVDIKGSTELSLKLDSLNDVKLFKDKLITTVIEIFTAFDGHIHRLQGDAVFAFFGGKKVRKSHAIVDALNAATLLQEYCDKQINPTFRSRGFPELKIRVGIDFGDDDEVLWAKYGIENCTEVTTTSLHTDLAAKLQNKAPENGIMIGDNVKQFLDLPDEFYVDEVNYILDIPEKKYKMWQFNWIKYLPRFLFYPQRFDSGIYKAGIDFQFKCFYKKEKDMEWKEYYPNTAPLVKNCLLDFRLSGIKFTYYKIRWYVNNRGKEAIVGEDALDFEMEENRDKETCFQATVYTGHHYMKCVILDYNDLVLANEFIGIYINDN
jgi:class 3 adenylate cyclase